MTDSKLPTTVATAFIAETIKGFMREHGISIPIASLPIDDIAAAIDRYTATSETEAALRGLLSVVTLAGECREQNEQIEIARTAISKLTGAAHNAHLSESGFNLLDSMRGEFTHGYYRTPRRMAAFGKTSGQKHASVPTQYSRQAEVAP